MLTTLLIPLIIAMFLAITMGGSGTSPSFSAAYGANLIRKDLIPGLFGIFVLLGAIIAGKNVVLTTGRGILPAETMTIAITTIVLISVAISLLFANLLGIPQSTSQCTVLSLTGSAVYLDMLQTKKLLFEIIPTWIILPIISFIIVYIIGKFIYKPLKKKGLFDFKNFSKHSLLKWFVIITSCYVAFAIGSNNVANASGPIVSMVINKLNIEPSNNNFILIMLLATLIIAPCFGIGSAFFGHKIVKTTGKEIVEFGPLGASVVSLVTASLLLLASVIKGIPTSLVQLNTCAIIALGITKIGWKKIIFSGSTVKKLLIVWIIAPIFSLLLSYLLTYCADNMGLLF